MLHEWESMLLSITRKDNSTTLCRGKSKTILLRRLRSKQLKDDRRNVAYTTAKQNPRTHPKVVAKRKAHRAAHTIELCITMGDSENLSHYMAGTEKTLLKNLLTPHILKKQPARSVLP